MYTHTHTHTHIYDVCMCVCGIVACYITPLSAIYTVWLKVYTMLGLWGASIINLDNDPRGAEICKRQVIDN